MLLFTVFPGSIHFGGKFRCVVGLMELSYRTDGSMKACHGILYQKAKFKMLHVKALPEDIAKTSQPQTWHEPRDKKIHGKAVQDLTVSGHSAKHTDPQTKNILL